LFPFFNEAELFQYFLFYALHFVKASKAVNAGPILV